VDVSRFWGVSLTVAGVVPLTALGHVPGWICGATAAVLAGCGLATWFARAGDVLLLGALVVVLLLVFWHAGPAVELIYAALLLGVAGAGVRLVTQAPARAVHAVPEV